ncbi:MAG TPA: hypothetical protein VHG08_26580 [Longimicrobium sp.]|nr:hypothetical protein [Longimicrobium sp.]
MYTTNSWRRRLLTPLVALAAVAVPLGFGSGKSLTVGEACAQTGTCYSNDTDTCFVNGQPYPGVWQAGG